MRDLLPAARSFSLFAGALLSALCFATASAQEARRTRLMDQPPFDVLTLDKANDSKVYKVYPIPLPARRVPERPRPTEKIRVRLLDTGAEYDIAWQHIEKLELYEQMVLAEARQFTLAGRLDDAFDALQFLLTFYPEMPGLDDARQNFLYASSGASFRRQKFDEALALLEELYALNPNFNVGDPPVNVMQRIGDVADRLIGTWVEAHDYRAARTLLARLARQYKADNEPFVRKWREELIAQATRQLEEARTHLTARRFVEAYDAAARTQLIWPELPGGVDLAKSIAEVHPLVRVGVDHPARAFDLRSITDHAARRAGRLRGRLLVEQTALGVEGGDYESPLAKLALTDDGLSLRFELAKSAAPAGYSLAQRLLTLAGGGSESYDAGWAKVVASIEVRPANELLINFQRPPLLPQSRLQVPLGEFFPEGGSPYQTASTGNDIARFASSPGDPWRRPGQPAEVLEHFFDDPQRALLALKRGEVDVLDRVFPGDIAALKSEASVTVIPYARPTTHVLVPRPKHPFLASATFRRALLYAANRELLLNQGLMRGAAIPGFRVVSSPFPAAVPGLETPAYAYDEQIEPRAYDARLGMALVLLAEGEIKSAFQKQEQPAPKREPLTLGHPADEVSRIACRGLAKDWKRIGVECKLVEFSPGVFDDKNGDCDLVYAQLSAWEPLVDAERLFGANGLAPATVPAIKLALRQIETAGNWQQVRRHMTALHRLVHEDATLLPLWQTVDHFAFRQNGWNLSKPRLHLYQNIDEWRAGKSPAGGQP